MDDHKNECACYRCQGIDVNALEKKAMEEYGFYMHYLTEADKPNSPTGYNCHTHGLMESFGVPDIQVVIPIPPKIIGAIFHEIVERIKNGERFEVNQVYTDIAANEMPTLFRWAVEDDRPVLRMIICDPNKNIKKEEMDDMYKHQYCGTSDIAILSVVGGIN